MSTIAEYEFNSSFQYGYASWRMRLKLRNHRGHRSVETVGWEVVEFSIEKLPEDEGDERPQPRFTFSLPAQELHRVRKWLKHNRDDRTIKHLSGEVNVDDLNSDSAWLLAMLELDLNLQTLPISSPLED